MFGRWVDENGGSDAGRPACVGDFAGLAGLSKVRRENGELTGSGKPGRVLIGSVGRRAGQDVLCPCAQGVEFGGGPAYGDDELDGRQQILKSDDMLVEGLLILTRRAS